MELEARTHARYANGSEGWFGVNWYIHWDGPYERSFSWGVFRDEDHYLDYLTSDDDDNPPVAAGVLDEIAFRDGLALAKASIAAALP